jgi:hypothetical protein
MTPGSYRVKLILEAFGRRKIKAEEADPRSTRGRRLIKHSAEFLGINDNPRSFPLVAVCEGQEEKVLFAVRRPTEEEMGVLEGYYRGRVG